MSVFSKELTIPDFMRTIADEKALILLLMKKGYLKDHQTCQICGKEMGLRTRRKSFEWRCRASKNSDCSVRSVKSGSYFSNVNLPLYKVFLLLISWFQKTSNSRSAKDARVSTVSATNWRNFFRQLCVAIDSRYPAIGGPNTVVEVDETCFHPRKYGKGEIRRELTWVFGGRQRDTKKVFARIVPSRHAKILVPLLVKNVHPASTIFSDSFRSYGKVKDHFHAHYMVNHSESFKNTHDDGTVVHTNSVESYWNRMKDLVRYGNGTSELLLPSYIAESVVRENEGKSFQQVILDEIKKSCR